MKDAGRFTRGTVEAIGELAYREETPKHEPNLGETVWAVGKMSDEGLERLGTFIDDLTRRAPLAGPAWVAHREVLQALEADIRRELTAREAERGDGT